MNLATSDENGDRTGTAEHIESETEDNSATYDHNSDNFDIVPSNKEENNKFPSTLRN